MSGSDLRGAFKASQEKELPTHWKSLGVLHMKVMSELEGRLEEDYYGKITYGMHRLLCLAPYSLVLSFCLSTVTWETSCAGQLGWMGGGVSEVSKGQHLEAIAYPSCRQSPDTHHHPFSSTSSPPLFSPTPQRKEDIFSFLFILSINTHSLLSHPLPSLPAWHGFVSISKSKRKPNGGRLNKQ